MLMNKRWASAFTIVELIIIIAVIAIIAAISIVGYNGIRKTTLSKVAQSDLNLVASEMQRTFQKTGEYPSVLPAEVTASDGIQLTVRSAGALPFYTNLSNVQNSTLLSQICSDLISEGVGKGTSQGGQSRDYITGCGNWNHNSMQVTGWNSKVWNTPVSAQSLIEYGANFTASTSWDIDQERVMEQFYAKLVERLLQEGGTFPVTSFWDYWATPQNGGVQQQPLEEHPTMKPYYCVESTATGYADIMWHVTETSRIEPGAC